MIKKSRGLIVFQIINIGLLVLISVVMVYPIYFALIVSVSDPIKVVTGNTKLIPRGINFEAYKIVLTSPEVLSSYMNSIIYAVGGTACTVVVTLLAAYPLSIRRFKGRSFFSFIFIVTMFFSGGMIPTYLVIKHLGLLNSRLSIILPPAFAVFYIIIMRTGISGIPDSLSESAYMDGANDLTILLRIILPLVKAMISTIVLFASIAYWNDFFHALLYLNDNSKFPLTIYLRKMFFGAVQNPTFTEYKMAQPGTIVYAGLIRSIKMASIIVSMLPIMMVYPFIQKYFVTGMMIGAVKG